MIYRNGFISNSSSSSFLLIGKKDKVIIGLTNIIEYFEKNGTDLPVFILSHKSRYEALNGWYPTTSQKNWMIKNKDRLAETDRWDETIGIIQPIIQEEMNDDPFSNIESDWKLNEVSIRPAEIDYHSFDDETTEADMEDFFFDGRYW